MLRWIPAILLICSAFSCFAQNSECFIPFDIVLPFDAEDLIVTDVGVDTIADINKSYFHESDEYSYWYKVNPVRTTTADLKLSATNLDDMHDVLIFKYNGNKFCEEVVHGDFPEEKLEDKILFHQNEAKAVNIGTYTFEEGSTYYIVVVSFNVFDCGHILRLEANDQVLRINAIHRGCFEFLEWPTQTLEPQIDTQSLYVEIVGHLTSDKEHLPIAGKMVFIESGTGDKYEAVVSATKGYRIQLRRDVDYRVTGSASYHTSKDTSVRFEKDSFLDLELVKLKKGDAMVFRDIYFHGNVHKMKTESISALEALLHFMEENPEYKIEIQGHTAGDTPVKEPDPRYRGKGKDWYFTGSAKKLSKMRAEEVKNYLVEHGISANRMKVVGYGATKKIYENPTSDREHRMNMRVEILILSD